MTTESRLRASVAWLSCVAALLIVPVPAVRGQESERRIILVNVLDQDGNQVSGLNAMNFRGEYQGQPVAVVSAAPDSAPRRIVVAMDTSASQMSRSDGEAGFTAAESLVKALTPRHRVAVFSLGNGLRMHSNLTNDPTALQKALGEARTRIGGPTALYDGVLLLSGGFSGRKPGDAICVFTDGEDTVDSRDRKAVVTAVARTGVRVFVVRTPPERPSAREHPQFQIATDWTESIAEATGGAASWLGDSHGLRTSSSMMAEAYRLELAFPRRVDEAREWRLEVVGPDGKALPNVRLVYPHLVAADAVLD